MKPKIKILAIILTFVLLLTSFAGCTIKTEVKDEGTTEPQRQAVSYDTAFAELKNKILNEGEWKGSDLTLTIVSEAQRNIGMIYNATEDYITITEKTVLYEGGLDVEISISITMSSKEYVAENSEVKSFVSVLYEIDGYADGVFMLNETQFANITAEKFNGNNNDGMDIWLKSESDYYTPPHDTTPSEDDYDAVNNAVSTILIEVNDYLKNNTNLLISDFGFVNY